MNHSLPDTPTFLRNASAQVVQSLRCRSAEYLEPLEREVVNQGTILRPCASTAAVAVAELRLGYALPMLYKEMLRFTNGLVLPSLENHFALLSPVELIGPFAELAPDALAFWLEGGMDLEIAPLGTMPTSVTMFREDTPSVGLLKSATLLSEVVNFGAVLACKFEGYGDEGTEIWEIGPWTGCLRFRNFRVFLEDSFGRYLTGETSD